MKRKPHESPVDPEANAQLADMLEQAVACLHQGGVVAFPTETSYGLAVDPYNEMALHALFRIKARDLSKPILVLIHEREQLDALVESVPPLYEPLIENFWPGPLTLIFPGHKNLSRLLTGGTDTVGVRISSQRIARELGRRWGKPVTATSANISGMRAATSAEDVKAVFGSRVDCIIDGGLTPAGACSTIVGIDRGCLQLYRKGQVDFSLILQQRSR